MNIVYGPVSSWRLGKSLGVDLICSNKKICSFDCIYCQLGKEPDKTTSRKNYITKKKLISEITEALDNISTDVITLSGTGEPTLAKNLDMAITTIKKITDIPIAILTNSSLMNKKDVRESLNKVDIVVAKLDASDEKMFQRINQPAKNISFKSTLDGILKFKKDFSGKFCIQTMFIEDNMANSKEIANIVEKIKPDEVQINTPLRPCPVKPLTKQQLEIIEEAFIAKDLNTISVYKSTKPKTDPLDKIEIFKRRRSIL